MVVLGSTYSEHLGAANGADTLNCRSLVLQDYVSGVGHFSLLAALDTIGLHLFTSFLYSFISKINYFEHNVNRLIVLHHKKSSNFHIISL